MKKITNIIILLILLSFYCFNLYSEELPKPTYDNSMILSMTYHVNGSQTEIEYIKSLYDNGLYAPLYFTHFINIDMDWNTDLNNADSGIQSFKNRINTLVSAAKTNDLGLHFIISYGITRYVDDYKNAKTEDIRNAMWYNDNNIASSSQLSSEINKYVFGTLSRYARKLREFHEKKIEVMFDFLSQVQADNPDTKIVISGPGEPEMNFYRLGSSVGREDMQDYFGDYSPYAVLEFRDWIRHTGLYASGQKYDGEGYVNGGSRYQDASGLTNFNSDFGTAFTSWDLKYYNWALTDSISSDAHAVPFSNYIHDGQLPSSGSNYISGGFDPARIMVEAGSSSYFDLWFGFRERMVANYVKDMASIGRNSGFPKEQHYTHQIPADYLFGFQASDTYKNERYYSSASPLWTADAFSDIGLGVTIYDVKIGTVNYDTTKYAVKELNNLSSNWGALEYNPEVLINGASPSSVTTLYNKFVDLYENNVHVLSLFKWETDAYTYKETNRGTALKNFFDNVKDRARKPMTTVFTPTDVKDFAGTYNAGKIYLNWNNKIWNDKKFKWEHWGDFKEFVIYRGYESNFVCNANSEIIRTSNYLYEDTGFSGGQVVYYKIAGVNNNNEVGVVSDAISVTLSSTPIAMLQISKNNFSFTSDLNGNVTSPQSFLVQNAGTADLNWSSSVNNSWINVSPDSGVNTQMLTITVATSNFSAGTYTGVITINDPNALNSPQEITVTLNVKASETTAPFGSFDTPLNASTVSSSIPVTGWALDDIEVENVKIFRDPLTGETPQANGYIYIGDAAFVEGARPDIELSYPDYPLNFRAGWGYMLLTNFLPNSGNGVFVLRAIATDKEGNAVELGSKSITCDNANAVKPFGAIDEPAQGGTVSGKTYLNWGWALTPQPNSIPIDGSTLSVIVDGVSIGHPVYNNYRSDIANLFPSYANSSGAVGYFYMDTTAFNNGVHTIQWSAIDSAGNSDGIGSRYFYIMNTSSDIKRVSNNNKTLSLKDFDNYKIINKEIEFTKGFSNSRLTNSFTDLHFVPVHGSQFKIKELERFVLNLNTNNENSSYLGYLKIGNQLRKLPIGSSLKDGKFYWSPGPGFIGEYNFVFVNPVNKERNDVRIIISPKYN